MEQAANLWEKVGTECLDKAWTLLRQETIPTAATVGMVKALVETAISIDLLNLRWAARNRFYAAASQGQAFSQPKAKKMRPRSQKG